MVDRLPGYFAICPDCGGIDFTDTSENYTTIRNYLRPDGSIAYNNQTFTSWFVSDVYCPDCDCQLEKLRFDEIDRTKRAEIYKMKPQERINWLKAHLMLRQLKKGIDNERNY